MVPSCNKAVRDNECSTNECNERVLKFECTPYSMNSLFSELFRKFGGAFWVVLETIWGHDSFWKVFNIFSMASLSLFDLERAIKTQMVL